MRMRRLAEMVLFVVLVSLVVALLFLLTRAGFGWGNWLFVILNISFFSLFFLLTQFRRKMRKRPASIYWAFIVALYAEMYGFSLTMYIFTWLFGFRDVYSLAFLGSVLLGEEVFYPIFMYIIFPASVAIMAAGILLIIYGWRRIFRAKDQLVTTGIYGNVRHPQYLGLLLLTLGMAVQWTTFFTLLLWPFLTILYYRLAKEEEREMEERFGEEYRKYKRMVPMFIPRVRTKIPLS